MNLPNRKHNRLEKYDYNQNDAYFVTICVKDRRKILSDIVGDDAHIVPKKCGTIIEKYIRNVPEIENYVIMPDHIHMIIRIESDIGFNNGTMWASSPTNKVSNIVRSLKILTTKEFGESVFQRSYYDHIIRNEQDYIETLEYIENNPKKWISTHKPQDDL